MANFTTTFGLFTLLMSCLIISHFFLCEGNIVAGETQEMVKPNGGSCECTMVRPFAWHCSCRRGRNYKSEGECLRNCNSY
ncbi:hypothetical protein H6P81_020982 [Aristolochia fimbriata]|uniref:Uncharacterized protein n=1 Tax=Aristolochia fimbriata TaxID=158543 RepID=A0AAV7E0C3_ARIFI|nr:hypothetical protein H6P81_020982 [Aristolochia fimbriata]